MVGRGTIGDVRRIFRVFYDEADREKPDYFPADEPAEKTYDTGRLRRERDIRGGRVTFESERDNRGVRLRRVRSLRLREAPPEALHVG
ncbi:hypothetical protein GCM10009039_34080 [Halocalculus aciditolerans]|uniref:Uncharacterized protein n=1 Tax=Halocalculus aciditolerans TaxID=1383812 RepID=A0A830F8B3_9EURY|nr:hypothetical protein GCM10009039_34080 [Halocalculus aciditolerans]